MTHYTDILAAAARLAGVAHRTPIATSRALDAAAGRALLLKCENLQRGGAFKFRGAYNAINQLPEAQRARGVLAFSSGNHAQGVALAAQLLGVPAVICMPTDAPAVKVAATREYGAEIVFYNRQIDDREQFTQRVAQERGLPLIPPFDHPHIIAGAGTAALELLQAAPDLDALVVPVGGGGLISGSALAAHGLRPDLPVYGVEPEDGDDVRQSLRAGQRECIPPPQTIADGLRTQAPGALTFPIIQQHIADIFTVSEDEIRAATRFALLRLKLVIEPSGAVGIAAALGGKLPGDPRRVGIIISGGNIDPEMLATLWG
ncbi:MAG: pyridoxal-phosphate dependent enzyme [Roseiflexaceae bacterium]|nr:pyridoxal-phosphate dependent enzyme [Roseiflexaceae bacterium]